MPSNSHRPKAVLTKKWTDWVDYWAVDFNYEHTYDRPGRYTVAVKVIDIFGNDTMTLVPVSVG